MRAFFLISMFFYLSSNQLIAQHTIESNTNNYLNFSWKKVATQMPIEWYGSADALSVADNLLLAQKVNGGWAKNKEYHHIFTGAEKKEFLKEKASIGATFDNGATITELRFLARVYNQVKHERYKQSFEKGLDYILQAQYENGGWPQFYPIRGKGDYSEHITYNDNAMVNIMNFLKDVESNQFKAFNISSDCKDSVNKAFNKGLECILKTQIRVSNKPTVWCAQHNKVTYKPVKARSYELASYSGSESVSIVQLLMRLESPSKEVVEAVNGAIAWFEEHKIEGIRIEEEIDAQGRKNRVVIPDLNAEPLWARFYDLETGEAFFCDRDGIKKKTLAEIGYERRNNYSWYVNSPSIILEQYDDWKKVNGIK